MQRNIDVEALQKAFLEDGYSLLGPQWSAVELDRLRSEAVALVAAERSALNFDSVEAHELNERRYFLLDMRLRSRVFAEFLRSEPYRTICTRLIGADVDTMYDAVIVKSARNGLALDWHQNEALNTLGIRNHLTCFTALGDIRIENGCLWVIPHSHLLGKLPHVPSESTVVAEVNTDKSGSIPVEMEAGCVLVLHPLVLHMSGANRSSEPRLGYVPFFQEAQDVFHSGRRLPCSALFRGGQPCGV